MALRNQAGAEKTNFRNYEAGKTTPVPATIAVLRQAFERAGVEFLAEDDGGPGVRLRKAKPKAKRTAGIDPNRKFDLPLLCASFGPSGERVCWRYDNVL